MYVKVETTLRTMAACIADAFLALPMSDLLPLSHDPCSVDPVAFYVLACLAGVQCTFTSALSVVQVLRPGGQWNSLRAMWMLQIFTSTWSVAIVLCAVFVPSHWWDGGRFFALWAPFDIIADAWMGIAMHALYVVFVRTLERSDKRLSTLMGGPRAAAGFTSLVLAAQICIVTGITLCVCATDVGSRVLGWRVHCAGWAALVVLAIAFVSMSMRFFTAELASLPRMHSERRTALEARVRVFIYYMSSMPLVSLYFVALASVLPAYYYIMLLTLVAFNYANMAPLLLFTSWPCKAALCARNTQPTRIEEVASSNTDRHVSETHLLPRLVLKLPSRSRRKPTVAARKPAPPPRLAMIASSNSDADNTAGS